VFEPRSATSRRSIFQNEYAKAFDFAESVFLAKPYDQSNIQESDRFSSEKLIADLTKKGKQVFLMESTEQGISELSHYVRKGDVIAVLSSSKSPRKYWNKLAERLREEGSESVTKCHQLKMQASDGKYYLTDAADTEVMLRIIQSVPSPNAEPFKLWLAQVGYERLEETADPELAITRALKTYLQKGYSKEWINQQLGMPEKKLKRKQAHKLSLKEIPET
jgi:hypothetical protein